MNVSEIIDAIGSEIVARNCYIVDVTISKDNDVEVTIESEEGTVELDDCVAISRYFESKFDREKEDYSLTVTSAGLDQPFKVLKQYQKAVGKIVEVEIFTHILDKSLNFTRLSVKFSTKRLFSHNS